jgi:Fe-S oxidoreductase/nitrate reductase gamma subunit
VILLAVFIFFLLAVISGGYFFYGICLRYRFTQLGRPENRFDRPMERWKCFFTNVIAQKKVREYPLFALMHFFIMCGFLILLIGMPNMVAEGLFHTSLRHFGDNMVFLFVKDMANALIIIGVLGVVTRRIFKKPVWLKNSVPTFVKLGLIFIIVLTEVFFHGARFALGHDPNLMQAAPLAFASSQIFTNIDEFAIHKSMTILWWAHFIAVFSLCFIVPNSAHLHLLFAPFNAYWHTLGPKGALRKIENTGTQEPVYGANKMEDFTWKQLFDAYTCVKCGRCNGQCPAQLSGETMKPKALNGRLRKHIEKRAPILLQKSSSLTMEHRETGATKEEKSGSGKNKNHLAGEVFEEEFIWSCTTCGGCSEVCPVSIEHVPKLIDLRRYLILKAGKISKEQQQVFTGIAECGNPWNHNHQDGYEWSKELWVPNLQENPQAEYLYYPGCAAIFDETAKDIAAAFVKVLEAAGVNFVVLGSLEWCCGETVRRMGNEVLFEKTVHHNIATWHKRGIKKIITTCPHCFNTLKNEYPQYGGEFDVIHHTAFLAGLLKEGKLMANKAFTKAVSFQDPCYLGRYNNLYSPPRDVLNGVPEIRLMEMPRSQKSSFCCGAGGGRIWTKSIEDNPITRNRIKEAMTTGAEVIGTACPFCKMVFSEAVKLEGNHTKIKVLDIAEILALTL